jgi:DNA-binding LacI/PurR family transcriptional regulator
VSAASPSRGAKPTQRDIARLAGVSHVTVSLALRNDPRITAATRDRVQTVAKRAGYQPDPHVAELMGRLRTGRRGAGAVVVAFLDFVHAHYGNKGSPTSRRFFTGAEARAQQLGYKLERLLVGADGLTLERVGEILKARNIRGVLLTPATHARERLVLDWARLAAVEFGRSLAQPILHRVCNHQAHTMRLVLESLTARGYRRCGICLTEGICARVDQTWPEAFLYHSHLTRPGEAPLPPLIRPLWNEAEFAVWFRQHRPDAVVTIHPPVLEWLRKTGVKIPAKVGFALLDWSSEMGDVAGVDQNSETVGAAALELVAAQLTQHEYGVPPSPKTILIEGVWRDGDTVRALL